MGANQDLRASLIERLYGTEAHAQILDVKQEQPLTKLLREVRQYLERGSEAIEAYDTLAEHIGTCGDGYCVVKRPVGMHTNGGCRCWQDKYKAQRMMMVAANLRAALADAAPQTDDELPPNYAACCSSTDIAACDCVNKQHIRVFFGHKDR